MSLPQGPGVRNDNGVYTGYTVPVHYDPMLSKLICKGATREDAIARMKRALNEYQVDGIETTIPFFTYIMDHPDFRAARFDTGFIDRLLPEMDFSDLGSGRVTVDAVIAAAVIMAFEDSQRVKLPEEAHSEWRRVAREESVGGRL